MFSQSVFFSCCSVCNIHNPHDCYSVWHFHLEMVTQGILWYGRNQTSIKKKATTKQNTKQPQTNKQNHPQNGKKNTKKIYMFRFFS